MKNDQKRGIETTWLVIAVLGGIGIPLATAFAQNQQRPPQRQQGRANLQNPVMQVPKLDPRLEQVLVEWERASKTVKTLEGEHERLIYDRVFLVLKRSKGKFYYEAPDKGRIDLLGNKAVRPGMTTTTRNKQTGKIQQFKVKSDQPERWICDGRYIFEINDPEKIVNKYPIPLESQGRNIMDGPLPFLFGMPAEKAKLRYKMKLLRANAREIRLYVEPRWKQDAANYKHATVILDPKTFLPSAVQMIDPAGTKETVFVFKNLAKNKKGGLIRKFFPKDPFHPPFHGFKIVVHELPVSVPSVIGMPWRSAEDVLRKSGLAIEFVKGQVANRKELLFVVYEQKPRHKTMVTKGQKIVLTLFTKPGTAPVAQKKRLPNR